MLRAFLLIVVGLAGSPEHGELFHKWGAALAEASARVGVTPDRLVYLVDERTEADVRATGRSTREEIRQALQGFAAAAEPDDVVYVVLIGHGSYNAQMPRFNLPGPDMGPEDFNALLRRLPARNVVLVNTSSSSGPWVDALSAPGRTIITATRSGAEQFTTLFGSYFVEAFSTEAADTDKNGRLSMLEAFLYAKGEVARAYEREGLLATEHALLDDNGDKQGSPDPTPTGADGKLAAALSLGSAADLAPLPDDPTLRALHLERRDLERRVEALRLLKDSMPPAKYASELERLVTELALKTREIRTLEGAPNNE
ncbi:MAG: caspase family protein [Acidobacteria bacterium]|nr:caspase family protein [Acidobacteriota bacterium]